MTAHHGRNTSLLPIRNKRRRPQRNYAPSPFTKISAGRASSKLAFCATEAEKLPVTDILHDHWVHTDAFKYARNEQLKKWGFVDNGTMPTSFGDTVFGCSYE